MLQRYRRPSNWIVPAATAATGYFGRGALSRSNVNKIQHSAISTIANKISGSSQSKGGAAPLGQKRSFAKSSRKKKVKKKSNYKLSKDVALLKNAQKRLKRECESSLGTLTYRKSEVRALTTDNNRRQQTSFSCNDLSQIETVLSQLKYYDPSNPAVLVTAAFAAGTYQKNCLIKSSTASLSFRNNYTADAEVKVYLCRVKDDTSQTTIDAWAAGVTDNGVTDNGTSRSLWQYPTDCNVFNDLYSSKVVYNSVLSPGQTAKVSHTEKAYEYDPSTADTHALSYQKEYKAFQFLITVNGSLSHDTANDQQGYCAASLDCLYKQTHVVRYDAGVNITRIYVDEQWDTPTNGFVQSHQPVADNIAYSIA